MTSGPSVTITLSPQGDLVLQLPGAFGSTRSIPLRYTSECDPAVTIRKVLESQAMSRTAIGEDGAPTRHQVVHWERHQRFRDDRCPFCRAEVIADALANGESSPPRSSHKFDARYAERSLGGGASVRVVKAGLSAKGQARSAKVKAEREAREHAKWTRPVKAKNAKELGL